METTLRERLTMAHTVGYLTVTGAVICRTCAKDAENLQAFRLGHIDQPIVDPSPNGIYQPSTNSSHYDRPCEICGWPVRRNR